MKRTIVEMPPDLVNDQARYSVTENNQPFEVSFSLTGKASAKPSPEAKINEWLDGNSAREGSIRIPDYHFQGF